MSVTWIRRLAVGATLGLSIAMGFGSTAAAYTEISRSGEVGEYGGHDTKQRPGARCIYAPQDSTGKRHLRAFEVNPPAVQAIDTESEQEVSWQFKIQRSKSGGPWATVASSPVQIETAVEENAAPFVPMRVNYAGKNQTRLRVYLVIKWGVLGASFRGVVNVRNDYYAFRPAFGQPDLVILGSCKGAR